VRSNKCLVSILLFVLVLATTAQAGPWGGPWSTSPDAPANLSPSEREPEGRDRPEQPSDSIAATPFFWLLTFYQKVVGRVNNGRCPMYPTCSRYSVLAIRKHGPVVGIVMTADRLIHELDEQRSVPLIKVGNRYRFQDPVENNDFWWYHE
jgi:putative component of membrane protein insertase Oxa1/YidC/SpoIIIJ protein YidD